MRSRPPAWVIVALVLVCMLCSYAVVRQDRAARDYEPHQTVIDSNQRGETHGR